EKAVVVLHVEPRVPERAARALGVELERGLVGREARRVLERADDGGAAPDAHRARLPANSRMSRLTASDCSSGAWWPACSRTARRAPGIARARAPGQGT